MLVLLRASALTLCLLATAPLVAAQSLPAWVRADARVLTGVWSGTYQCSQGPTELRLTVLGDATGTVSATFAFSATAGNPDVPSGRYEMAGAHYADGRVVLVGTRWTDQPEGYLMIDVDGWVESGAERLRGTLCGYPVSLRKRSR